MEKPSSAPSVSFVMRIGPDEDRWAELSESVQSRMQLMEKKFEEREQQWIQLLEILHNRVSRHMQKQHEMKEKFEATEEQLRCELEDMTARFELMLTDTERKSKASFEQHQALHVTEQETLKKALEEQRQEASDLKERLKEVEAKQMRIFEGLPGVGHAVHAQLGSPLSCLQDQTVVAIKTAHGNYLSAQRRGELKADSSTISTSAMFTMVRLRRNIIALKSCALDKYLTAVPGGRWVINRGDVARWEMFEVGSEDGETKISLKAHTGYWMSANAGFGLEAKAFVGDNEKFLLEVVEPATSD
eukprot:TRINITY_DN8556_c0_g1_i1.p1 TRINITY_DN8556_c0_g1~~TRINITY_DN8556_c0_g1_i1.p1  ORF type:complete len:302 (+),score=58.29 TRINITY_DN8556_c0_g1_i1:183-1088(+)